MRALQVRSPEDILAADRLVFPGVGAFEQAMGALQKRGFVEPLKDYILVSIPAEILDANLMWIKYFISNNFFSYVEVLLPLHSHRRAFLQITALDPPESLTCYSCRREDHF